MGEYIFKDSANRNVTVIGERYREMLCKMQNLDFMTIGFYKACHTARVAMDLLMSEFSKYFISRS